VIQDWRFDPVTHIWVYLKTELGAGTVLLDDPEAPCYWLALFDGQYIGHSADPQTALGLVENAAQQKQMAREIEELNNL
jgi:hypothetical protein